MPVFVANGDSDPMVLPHYSYLLAGLIPQAQVKIYPDSAHGFLFQHHAEFAADVEAFLGMQMSSSWMLSGSRGTRVIPKTRSYHRALDSTSETVGAKWW